MLHRRGLRVAKVVVLVAVVVWASAGVWVGDGAASAMARVVAWPGAADVGRGGRQLGCRVGVREVPVAG